MLSHVSTSIHGLMGSLPFKCSWLSMSSESSSETSNSDPLVIHMWCGPRSLSTGTMYSFAQRPDTQVVDEPLYPHWLARNPSIFRPYKKELFETYSTDGNAVLRGVKQYNGKGKRIIFMKHIIKQLEGIDRSVLYNKNAKHVFLVRDPLEMIMSWGVKSEVHQEECSLETMGLPTLVDLYSHLRKNTGVAPVVVDSNMLKENPRAILSELCASLGIPFCEEQLSWPAGPKPSIDGIWASYWYDKAHASTGFNTFATTDGVDAGSAHAAPQVIKVTCALSPEQIQLYREVLPFYDLLRAHAIGVDPLSPGSSVHPKSPVSSAPVIDHGITVPTQATPAGATAAQRSLAKLSDPRNAHVLVWVGDRLLPRELAKVSVFDSSVQGGDAVWEGLRVYENSVFKLEEHINRLFDSAKAMDFANLPSRAFIQHAIFTTLRANGMTRGGAHMRMTLSRGAKITSSMNPVFNIFGTCLIILPEWKPVGDQATYDNNKGIMLITATGRRNSPQCVDSKIHHNNLINNILPKIQANYAGAADALMLDPEGFVSETNATNVFMVKHGVVYTPHADYCLPGVTRETVMEIVPQLGLRMVERRLSLAEFHAAEEVFTTGTMGELTPVYQIDGRSIGYSDGAARPQGGSITRRIQAAYTELTKVGGFPIPEA